MADVTTVSWQNVIRGKHDAFASRRCELLPRVDSERSFRPVFEALCRSQNEFNHSRLLASLSFASINAFAKAVDGVFRHDVPSTLGHLVFSGCFAIVQCGCEARMSIADVVEILYTLNTAVPWLAPNIPRFPRDPDVQTPLQSLFSTYIDVLLFTIDCFTGERSGADYRDALGARLQEASADFQQQKRGYEDALERTQRVEARALSTSSYASVGSASDFHSNLHGSEPQFITKRSLGKGFYGMVHEVHESSTGRVYARKQIYLGRRGSDTAMALMQIVTRECDTMERLSHPHIIKMCFSRQEDDHYYIYMQPVADQDLRAYLGACVKHDYPESALRSIFQWFGCLLKGLSFAHGRDIVHYDIKPANILVKAEGERLQVYLADFGMAKDFSEHSTGMAGRDNVRGTPIYRAPEVKPHAYHGPMSDMFSLGCVFSEMLTVCCQRSLDDYENFRYTPREDSIAFRANLPKVQEWLASWKGSMRARLSRLPFILPEG
ncbi:hypothetical protein B0A55_04798 [Friedmanniomyces simplex]|uniref:mitogen-activated protein kinase n=1 Tax=Friedmanniomyces simplex TaxID=329884 RepID=A0A4U0XG00_9PEZI|nr:hypothetical protein B0A55_04798 [Friedmanniomyces simplex]